MIIYFVISAVCVNMSKLMSCFNILILILSRLNFDNSAYRYIMKEDEEEQEILPITSDFFFEVFPFNIVFRQVISAPELVNEGNEASNEQQSLHSSGHGGA